MASCNGIFTFFILGNCGLLRIMHALFSPAILNPHLAHMLLTANSHFFNKLVQSLYTVFPQVYPQFPALEHGPYLLQFFGKEVVGLELALYLLA